MQVRNWNFKRSDNVAFLTISEPAFTDDIDDLNFDDFELVVDRNKEQLVVLVMTALYNPQRRQGVGRHCYLNVHISMEVKLRYFLDLQHQLPSHILIRIIHFPFSRQSCLVLLDLTYHFLQCH